MYLMNNIMKRIVTIVCIIVLTLTVSAQPVSKVPLKKYLEFARSAADWTWNNYDSLEQAWIKSIDPKSVFGYRPPSRFLEAATIYATLYELEGNRKYAERARSILLRYDDYKKYFRPKTKYSSRGWMKVPAIKLKVG